ncbi:SusD-like starch-binding protein associating with outer membrane [Lutibacter sp. Hel_I_33_5]|uniref:RagB/SusD family nutrient uptake outer membrane protein n=1 Tax=Lutibacter sp. Hel_I_33_5 TaxID=1566289 RepID=UPI0011A80A63|nr:RagB/SusD family nutrient uptake outer membrane protein [Lutibacter sp. Hel_I_33_5]TVZ54957.1 SusD-like starch-binding protein associating with outer membrane [Lutibacter sp. Hel_I_33_5]
MIINKINRKFWTKMGAFVLLVLLIISCADLEEDPNSVQFDPAALNSDTALETLVAGMYSRIQNDAQWSAFFITGYAGDDISTRSTSNKAGFRDSDWRQQTPGSARLGNAYNGCYRAIATANTAISIIDNIKGDAGKIQRLLGETYFIRAFAYLHLTRTYGRIPIQLKPTSNDKLKRASFVDIYKQIEADLKQAETLLPNVYPGIPAVGTRPNKGSAKAYLARLYLQWAGYPEKDLSKYALAASKSWEVIKDKSVYGFDLATDFRAMWTEDGRFKHNEGIFTLIGCTVGCGVGNRTTGRLGLTNAAGGWNETFGEIAFYNDQKTEATKNGTMKRFDATYIHEKIPRADEPIGADFMSEAKITDRHPMFRKIVGGDFSETVNTTRNDINRYFMRYAEVLLIYAEASGRAGNVTANSWKALNDVRNRAGATTPLTAVDGNIEDLAFTERKWEFAGEYERWNDLVRMEKAAAALGNRSALEDVDVSHSKTPSTDASGKYFYFSPIPQSQLDLAPELND